MKQLLQMLRALWEGIFGAFMQRNAGNAAKAALRERSGNLAEARSNAASNQGLISDLEGELKAARQEESEWLASGRKAKAADDQAEMERAAKTLGRIRNTISDLEGQLETAQVNQANYLETIRDAGDDLEDDRRDVRSLEVRRKMANSQASLDTGFADNSSFDEAKRNLESATNRAEGQVTVNKALKSGPKYGGADTSAIMDEF